MALGKSNMEGKGLRVNVGKTSVEISGPGLDMLQKSPTKASLVCVSRVSAQIQYSVKVVPVGDAVIYLAL